MEDLNQLLAYPLDTALILRKRKKLTRQIMEQSDAFPEKRIAILSGSTTEEFQHLLELFLLHRGFRVVFYTSPYGLYYEEAVFENPALSAFKPDLIYLHTTVKNVNTQHGLEAEVHRWEQVITGLKAYACPIILNNVDFPGERPLGNLDGVLPEGKTQFVRSLNQALAERAREIPELIIQDINYLSACVGLDAWIDRKLWYAYRYAVSTTGMVHLAFNLANMICGVFGRSKKVLILDLDNTCWGGVIGDDGIDGIQLGEDEALGEAHRDLQAYAKALSERGIALAVASKNDEANAKEGFTHPDTVLTLKDFAAFQANWEPKPQNILAISEQLNLSPDAFVFLDDNEMERDLVATQLPMVAVPDPGEDITTYIDRLDRNGYFEASSLSAEDIKRSAYYQANQERSTLAESFTDFNDYLASLAMEAEIDRWQEVYLDRITQLTNKTNQFNLTTQRFQHGEMKAFASDDHYITLYGKLKDTFGDNGLVSVVAGRIVDDELHIFLWLMSCRVLKRGMENAMADALIQEAKSRGLKKIIGEYMKSAKNQLVETLYADLGFRLQGETDQGTTWVCDLANEHAPLNQNIKVVPYGK
ncbi:MAG: FkbH-like protein [Candidatus Omnitrophota bacterium]|jgi:FkbH-like protein